MSDIKRHYAIRKKVKLFQLFDEGKRPADIAGAPVTRKTLYQYFYEWRRERPVERKKTDFANKKFDRETYLQVREEEKLGKQREGIARYVMDWVIALVVLKRWEGIWNIRETPLYL